MKYISRKELEPVVLDYIEKYPVHSRMLYKTVADHFRDADYFPLAVKYVIEDQLGMKMDNISYYDAVWLRETFEKNTKEPDCDTFLNWVDDPKGKDLEYGNPVLKAWEESNDDLIDSEWFIAYSAIITLSGMCRRLLEEAGIKKGGGNGSEIHD